MRIIIADSSAVVRAILDQHLSDYDDIEILASVSNASKAASYAKTDRPDIVIVGNDINEKTEQDSLKALLNEMKLSVIVLTDKPLPTLTFQKKIKVLDKPNLKSYSEDFFTTLIATLRELTNKNDSKQSNEENAKKGSFKILCIGASTGGPTAVAEVLQGLGKNFPYPVLYAQHIEVGADKNLASWLSETCTNIRIKLAENGEEAVPGTVYMAPADKHLIISYVKSNTHPVLELSNEEPERFLRPAVNKLFRSAAESYKSSCLAILLTGMGADGAEGCKRICERGGWTIVEDKSTCAVFGMPAAAIELGGAKEILARPDISKRILSLVQVYDAEY